MYVEIIVDYDFLAATNHNLLYSSRNKSKSGREVFQTHDRYDSTLSEEGLEDYNEYSFRQEVDAYEGFHVGHGGDPYVGFYSYSN